MFENERFARVLSALTLAVTCGPDPWERRLLSPDPPAGGGGGGGNPAPSPAPAPAPTPAPAPEPFAVFPTSEDFQKRVERETRKALKALGIDDPDQVRSVLEDAAKARQAAEDAKKAQMSEADRLRAEKAEAEAKASSAMSAAEEAKMRAHCYRIFAEKGVRNFEYAFFAVTSKLAAMGDDEELDVAAHLDGLAKDPTQAIALGIAAPAAPAPAPPAPPAQTTPRAPGAPPPPAPPPPGAPAQGKTAMDMTPEEWAQRKAGLGIY